MDAAILRSFLDDLKADPFDDTPRLILADWLEDHATTEVVHARGTLLRLQCEAAARPEHDPEAVAMRQQARELIALHEHVWLGDFADLPIIQSQFVRGMLHLTLHGPELLSPGFASVSPASWQWVEGLNLLLQYGVVRQLEASPILGHITRLEITQQHGFADWLGLLESPHLTQLRELSLIDSECRDRYLSELCTRPVVSRLRRLSLRVSGVNCPGWQTLARSAALAGLESLQLGRCGLGGDGFRAVATSPSLTRLRELDLSYNGIPGEALRALAPAAFAPTVERLVLAGNPLDRAGLAALAGAPLDSLRHLDLGYCELFGDVGEALAEVLWLGHLHTLDLTDASVTPINLAFLTAPLRSLCVLRLARCGLLAEDMSTLATAPDLSNLRELDLSNNLLEDPGVADLVRGNYPGLRVLNLDGNGLTDEAVRRLADWPGLAELWLLSLARNTLTETSVDLLVGSVYRSPRTRIVLSD
jgi:uncharacterized protein (TIGR02996 family)